ncbi:MAG: hypothetical protein EAZ92_01185 [Candidatus Kapaibacterium sp.]|nr:MAG: hypothetical protein EAZ92_01185 [Candidatus Kapabacteria bacterium]
MGCDHDPEGDGKTKIDHVHDMFAHTITYKRLDFSTVLMDSWYAASEILKRIERAGNIYYCPIKGDRRVDETDAAEPHVRVDSLEWTAQERFHGKTVHLRTMPHGHRVKLFRLVISPNRTDDSITNERAQDSVDVVKEILSIRWKIEQFFRESKQCTGLERCQCRLARIQRNHIGYALLVWHSLKERAEKASSTLYQLKRGVLDDYIRQQLAHPSLRFS